MRPLNTVQKSAFRNLRNTLSGRKIEFPSSRSFKKEIDEKYVKIKATLEKKLNNQKYLCITADVWSCHGLSYLGMTVHYYDEELERQSFIMSFEKLNEKHTAEYLAKIIHK